MSKEMYGRFKCPNCNRKWESGHAWGAKGSPTNPEKAMGQKCINCFKGFVKPIQLDYKKKPDGINVKKPHLQDNCQKCKYLGRSCC